MSRDSFKLPDNERGSIKQYLDSMKFNENPVSINESNLSNYLDDNALDNKVEEDNTRVVSTSTIGSTGTRQTTLAKGFPANLNEDNIEEEYFKTDAAKELVGQWGALPAQSEQKHKKRKVNEKEKKKAYKLLGNLIEAIQTAESNQKKYSRFSPRRMVNFIWKKVNEIRLQRLARKNNIPTEIVERLKATTNRTELKALAPSPKVSQQQLAREEDTESIAEIKKMGKLYVEDSFAYTAYEGKSVADTIADRVKRGQLKPEVETYDEVVGSKKRKVKVKRKVRKKKKVKKTQSDPYKNSAPQKFENLLVLPAVSSEHKNKEAQYDLNNFKTAGNVKALSDSYGGSDDALRNRPKSMKHKDKKPVRDRSVSTGSLKI